MFVETGHPIPYKYGHVHLFRYGDVMVETELNEATGVDAWHAHRLQLEDDEKYEQTVPEFNKDKHTHTVEVY